MIVPWALCVVKLIRMTMNLQPRFSAVRVVPGAIRSQKWAGLLLITRLLHLLQRLPALEQASRISSQESRIPSKHLSTTHNQPLQPGFHPSLPLLAPLSKDVPLHLRPLHLLQRIKRIRLRRPPRRHLLQPLTHK